ncbi:hypothetical protein WDZ92_03195, partial [Nostoc sp. NIES-2111]
MPVIRFTLTETYIRLKRLYIASEYRANFPDSKGRITIIIPSDQEFDEDLIITGRMNEAWFILELSDFFEYIKP